jgi:hypothetical protein
MFNVSTGEIFSVPGVGVKVKVSFSSGPEGASMTVVLEEKDYTLAEARRLAIERAYEIIGQIHAARPDATA